MKKCFVPAFVGGLLILTGCGQSNKMVDSFNAFVNDINSGDYTSALALTTLADNRFINEELFEQAIDYSGLYWTSATDAEKIKGTENTWNFSTKDDTVTCIYDTNGRLNLSELLTDVELYVPTGSECCYNGVELTTDMISMSDELETTYTIKAPIVPGVLTINAPLFGEIECTVDPEFGYNDELELPEDLVDSAKTVLLEEINKLNSFLDKGDVTGLSNELQNFVNDKKSLELLVSTLSDNRKITDEFTSYHNATYAISDISSELLSADSIKLHCTFNVVWVIGESGSSGMTVDSSFDMRKSEEGWTVTSIDDWNFLFLNGRLNNE